MTSADGFFLICAIDHLSDYAELLAPDPSTVTFADVVASKDAVVRALAPNVSAFLVDPLYALGHLVGSGAVPGNVGQMSSIEDEDYQIPPGPRRTRLREHWSAKRIKMAVPTCASCRGSSAHLVPAARRGTRQRGVEGGTGTWHHRVCGNGQ